jgi:hypothetical protein
MYYKIVDTALIKAVEAIYAKRHEAEAAFMRLSRRVGASRTRYGASGAFGPRRFAFLFSKEPNRKHWKRDRSGDFWEPKLSSKEGKKIHAQIQDIEQMDGSRWELAQLFGIGDIFKSVGIRKVDDVIVVEFGDDWKFSAEGLGRISDVELEELEQGKQP